MPGSTDTLWHDFALGGLVQQWVNRQVANHGVLVKHADEAAAQGNSTYYHADDHTVTPALRPKLSLTYREPVQRYSYDRLSRLTEVKAPSGLTTYEYDAVGNRLTRTRSGTPTPYTYDKADHLLTVGGVAYTVDDNGNLADPGTGLTPEPYGYDQANRLTSARVGSTTTTYRYDGDGKRVSTTVGTNPSVSYFYDVNRSLPVLLEDGTRTYVWGLGLLYSVEGTAPNERVSRPGGGRRGRGGARRLGQG